VRSSRGIWRFNADVEMGILPDIRVGDGIRPDLGRPEQNFIPYGR